jgi:hypothetical protein
MADTPTESQEPEDDPPLTRARLRASVFEQTPAVFMTLLSVLVGLVLSDLVTEARARMHLWPLDLTSLRTWGQLFANGACAISVWIILAHLGMVRRRVPHLGESLIAFGPPFILLTATTFVGRPDMWPWLYFACIYLAVSVVAVQVSVRMTMEQPGGERFAVLLRPTGCLGVMYLGSPLYLLAGFLDQQGWLTGPMEAILALSAPPPALLAAWLFFRDWRKALDQA